jgi:hypothetical protein
VNVAPCSIGVGNTQTNLFGFHSSDSIAGGELGNAFRDGTWSRDPHLRRFVLRQGSLLVLPFVAIGIIDALTYGMWLPIAVSLLSVGLVILSLRKSFHR